MKIEIIKEEIELAHKTQKEELELAHEEQLKALRYSYIILSSRLIKCLTYAELKLINYISKLKTCKSN